jgi:hypothetical protein
MALAPPRARPPNTCISPGLSALSTSLSSFLLTPHFSHLTPLRLPPYVPETSRLPPYVAYPLRLTLHASRHPPSRLTVIRILPARKGRW